MTPSLHMDLFKSLLADQNLKAPLAYRIGSQIARSNHEKMRIYKALTRLRDRIWNAHKFTETASDLSLGLKVLNPGSLKTTRIYTHITNLQTYPSFNPIDQFI